VLFYLAIAAGAVTHADLFLENPVKLPFLNIELPLLAFFFVAPILFLVVHAYTLVHLVMLANKAEVFHVTLRNQIRVKGVSEVEKKRSLEIRTGLRRQLPSNIFVQLLAGPADTREGAFGWLLRVIASVTLVVAACVIATAQPANAVVGPGGHYPPVESLQARSFVCETENRRIFKVDVQPAHRLMQISDRNGNILSSYNKVNFAFTGAPARDAFGMSIAGNMDWDWETASTAFQSDASKMTIVTLNPDGWTLFYKGEHGKCLIVSID